MVGFSGDVILSVSAPANFPAQGSRNPAAEIPRAYTGAGETHKAPGTQVAPPFLAEAKSGTAGHRMCECLLFLRFPVRLNPDPGHTRPRLSGEAVLALGDLSLDEPQLPPLVTTDTSELRAQMCSVVEKPCRLGSHIL